jgi:hypothetical protein
MSMDHLATKAAFDRFFAARRAAWADLLRALAAAGVPADVVGEINVDGQRSAAILRVDLQATLERSAVRSSEIKRLAAEARRAIREDAQASYSTD